MAGVQGVKVLDNEVTNNKPTGPSVFSGGVVIATAGHPASPPTNNLVKDNNLHGNQPADIFWDQTGTGNKVTDNDCDSAIPGTLGWCTSH